MRKTIVMIRATFIAALFLASAGLWGCVSSDVPPGIADALTYLEQGREAARHKNHEEAIRLFTLAVKSNSENAEAYYERAKSCIQVRLDPQTVGDSRAYENQAVDDFSSAIQKNPAYADAYFNRAMLLSSRAQYKPAVDDLLNAVRFKPQDPEAHLCLGEIYENKFEDRMVLAMDHYEKYVDLGGTNGVVREKVRLWKDLKKQIGGAGTGPSPSSKAPTAEEEKKAAELHQKGLELLKNVDKTEAVKTLEECLTQYGHTKYVQERVRALQAAVAAFKKKDAPK